jgi:hypothetical protein
MTQITLVLSAGGSSVAAGLVSAGIHGHGGGQEEEGTTTEEAGGEGSHDVQFGLSFGMWPVNAGLLRSTRLQLARSCCVGVDVQLYF